LNQTKRQQNSKKRELVNQQSHIHARNFQIGLNVIKPSGKDGAGSMRCSDSETDEQADKDTDAVTETLKELRDESNIAKEVLIEFKDMNIIRKEFIIKTKIQMPLESTETKSNTNSRSISDYA